MRLFFSNATWRHHERERYFGPDAVETVEGRGNDEVKMQRRSAKADTTLISFCHSYPASLRASPHSRNKFWYLILSAALLFNRKKNRSQTDADLLVSAENVLAREKETSDSLRYLLLSPPTGEDK
jgi:hypothetical protein